MNRIRQLRRQKNMTQQDVGQALGVGNTAVSMYIRNLCKLFGCSADYLLGLTDYRPSLTKKDVQNLEAYHSAVKEERNAIDKMLRKARKK